MMIGWIFHESANGSLIKQALGAPIYQLEGVKGRVTAHAHIDGVGDAAGLALGLQAHGRGVGLTHLAAAGNSHILCNFGRGVDCPTAAAGLRYALEKACAEHANFNYSFMVHGSTGNLTGENLGI